MKPLFLRALAWIWILSSLELLPIEPISGYIVESEQYGFKGTAEVASVASYKYDRVGEVKKQCASVLKSAAPLNLEGSRIYNIKDELYFVNGDWEQDSGGAPILPFDDREVPRGDNLARAPLKLASFWIVDVGRSHKSKKAVFVSGLMSMGITRDGSFSEMPYEGSREFEIWAGHTRLSIRFQGVYTESSENNGDRVLCLLGSTVLPSRETDSDNPWKWVEDFRSNYNTPPLSQDDQIRLVLRFPMNFTLFDRMIQGTLTSLNPKSNPKYFDEVKFLSQLGKGAHYEFRSGKEILAKSCDPYPYRDSFINKGGVDIYKGSEFCRILEEVARGQALTIVPNWRCNGTDAFCSKLGPFGSDKAIKATDGGFKNVWLYIQDIKCEQEIVRGNVTSSRVAAVFRAVPPDDNQYTASARSGPSNMTLASEGIWESPSGQLCMIGCLGSNNTLGKGCHSRICLYVPTSFSIEQRSILVGTLSTINNNSASPSFFPLTFEKLVQPAELWNYFRTSSPKYTYSKIDSAGTILEKNEAFSFRTVIKKSLLQFPRLEDAESYFVSLSYLSEDLALHTSAIPDPSAGPRSSRISLQMEIISLGPLFGRFWSANGSTHDEGNSSSFRARTEYTEQQLLLNVSAQLSFMDKDSAVRNLSVLFLEGLYDPHVGRMYLVGCRDVRASWEILHESMDLESGLDCLIEAVVSYPPTTARWLIDPAARISISSQRTEDDPLYFKPVKLRTLPVFYRQQREDILSERGVEGFLRILTLSIGIAFISAQLFYINNSSSEYAPFVSLVMLGVQALGYSLPLITGAEAVFKRNGSGSSAGMMPSYNLGRSPWFNVIDYTVKLLVMVSFLLTLRLFQKVWKSRSRLQGPGGPSDKQVLVTTLIVHIIGYGSVLIGHALKSQSQSVRPETYFDSSSVGNNRVWETKLEEYVGLAHDFFLLPQVIGNSIWRIETKPLRKLYYIGITTLRLLPHLYDSIRAPPSNPYVTEGYEFVNRNTDFFSKLGDSAIPAIGVLLAAVVYVQQRWDYEKLREVVRLGRFKILPARSRAYERLSSTVPEAELVPAAVNENKSLGGGLS